MSFDREAAEYLSREEGIAPAFIEEAAPGALTIMREDPLYQTEYQQFVDAMSYASDAERIGFEEALEHFDSLSKLF